MSSALILSILPKCDLTKNNREETIRAEIRNVNALDPDTAHLMDVTGVEDLTGLKESVLYAVGQYMQFSDNREVVVISIDGSYSIYAAGGMSSGDDPTDSYRDLNTLNLFPGVFELLHRWAFEDMCEQKE